MELRKLKLKKDKRGVFGLTAVQSFFSIILGIALLAYVIVVIMGTLSDANILKQASDTITNETVTGITASVGQQVSNANLKGFGEFSVSAIYNGTGGALIPITNYTTYSNGSVICNEASYCGWDWLVNYGFSYDTDAMKNQENLLGNVSGGITGFFSAINPIYSILAVLVIILVLVVLVRVVQNPNSEGSAPQL